MLLMANNSWSERTVISIEGATIRGDQELPTVLYLVPWQPPKVYSIDKPQQTLASSRLFKQLDRASFVRMQAYHEAFMKELKTQSNETKSNQIK